MKNKRLYENLKGIEMPNEMKHRIIRNCYSQTEDKSMNNTTKKNYRKPLLALAAVIVCLVLATVTTLATTGKLQGYFKDIKNPFGAVTGTSYEQATDEVSLEITKITDALAIEITFLEPQKAPYMFFETFGINSYSILDENGNIVAQGELEEMNKVNNSTTTSYIPVNEINSGIYTLYITELIGGSKADQPLVLNGNWEIEFAK